MYSGHTLFLVASLLAVIQQVSSHPNPLGRFKRTAPDNTVIVRGVNDFCIIVPRDANTAIGDSEQPGGMTSYCTPTAHFSEEQGVLDDNFWSHVDFRTGSGVNGERYAQLTGCINPFVLDRINQSDDGGQYDSSGGSGGNGNPAGSVCLDYNHYVEILEPSGPRACIRCCDDLEDCPTNLDMSGCPQVIPGEYYDCA